MANPKMDPLFLQTMRRLAPWTAGGVAAGGVGAAGAMALDAATPSADNDKDRVRKALALEAMREGANPDTELLKMYLGKKAMDPENVNKLLMTLGGGAMLAGPVGYKALSISKERKGAQDLDKARLEALLARGLYERSLRGGVLERMSVPEEALKSRVGEMEAAVAPRPVETPEPEKLPEQAKAAFEIPDILPKAGLVAGGVGAGMLAYGAAKDASKAPSAEALRNYRKNVELASQLSNKPIGGAGLFTPEELVALDDIRNQKPAKSAGRAKADLVKDTKGGTTSPGEAEQTHSVKADPSDPELERLLASV